MKRHVSSLSIFSSHKKEENNTLFRGIWLRWGTLTQAEKVVCAGIILVPLWWSIGWGLMTFFWLVGIAIYELRYHQKIRLSRPSLEVIAFIIFSFYRTISYAQNTSVIIPRVLIDPILTLGCGGILIWYIQSHNIRVRLQTVAWAFSILICTMLLWWLFFHFVLLEPYYIPPRTLFAVITSKGTYDPSKLGSVGNYLAPYYPDSQGLGGLLRYTFFFPHPTVSSFAIGFAGLIALDIKNRWWSLGIVAVCVFLILICQARNAWLALSIVLVVRWLITTGKTGGLAFLLSLFAITSFTTLSLPSVTDWISDTYTNTVEATSNFRKDSTDTRSEIYYKTWNRFIEEPLLGHGVNGPPVQPGYEFATIGSESFVLGNLLYKSGLLGTGVFLIFFISLLTQLYKTRGDRPLCCFLMLLYFSIASLFTEFLVPEGFIIMLCIMLRNFEEYKLKQAKKFKSTVSYKG